jgi:hypothetical protein
MAAASSSRVITSLRERYLKQCHGISQIHPLLKQTFDHNFTHPAIRLNTWSINSWVCPTMWKHTLT